VQCTDDSNGARPCIDSSGEGRLLRELRNSLNVGLATLRALRIRADHSIGSLDPRAVGSEPRSSRCLGCLAIRLEGALLRYQLEGALLRYQLANCYSVRKVCIGSTDTARRAGNMDAVIAVVIRAAAASMNQSGLFGATPNRKPRIA